VTADSGVPEVAGAGNSGVRQVPLAAPGAGPYAVAVGPDGALWVTLVHAGQVARVNAGGVVVLHDLGAPDCRPCLIVAGPDEALWFTRSGDDRIGDDRIGRITVDGEVDAVDPTAGGPS
jgi:virginiamycin B lyase